MRQRSRREFLTDVGRGMVVASVGSALAADMGLAPAWAAEEPPRLTFGKQEALVALLQETAPNKLLPILTERLASGTSLAELTSAAALANARTFGGEDYIGFHTLMALVPAFRMSQELPKARQPLPILKVLYRNTNRIQETGGHRHEVLHPIAAARRPEGKAGNEALRDAVRKQNMQEADGIFASLAQGTPVDALNDLLPTICDGTDVHRVVLISRAWELIDLVGNDRAHTLLRQSVHFCVKQENPGYVKSREPLRALLPKLMDRYHLAGRPLGNKTAEDAWVSRMSETLFKSNSEQAADAVAAALAEGFSPDAIGEAISLGANQLVLRDNGRPANQVSGGKPVGSVHGDGIGVHASDSVHAWRTLAHAASPTNAAACLILAGYQLAADRTDRGGDFIKWEAYPRAEARERVTATEADKLLKVAEDAIRAKDQALACAAVHRYGEQGHPARPVFEMLLGYAVSEDGALHAEKYYRTVTEEFARTRPAFRWRQLIALARVTASEYGLPAPGYAESCKLLKV